MQLEQVLLQLGAPILATIISNKFGKDAGELSRVAVEALAEAFGVQPTRAAVEDAILPGGPEVAERVAQAEARMDQIILAQAELQRAGNEQQARTNELLLAPLQAGKPTWTWAWLYAWQWFLMAIWGWTLVGVHVANAGLRLAGEFGGLPAPDAGQLLTLTTLYLGLHMGGHTVLEVVRNGLAASSRARGAPSDGGRAARLGAVAALHGLPGRGAVVAAAKPLQKERRSPG